MLTSLRARIVFSRSPRRYSSPATAKRAAPVLWMRESALVKGMQGGGPIREKPVLADA